VQLRDGAESAVPKNDVSMIRCWQTGSLWSDPTTLFSFQRPLRS